MTGIDWQPVAPPEKIHVAVRTFAFAGDHTEVIAKAGTDLFGADPVVAARAGCLAMAGPALWAFRTAAPGQARLAIASRLAEPGSALAHQLAYFALVPFDPGQCESLISVPHLALHLEGTQGRLVCAAHSSQAASRAVQDALKCLAALPATSAAKPVPLPTTQKNSVADFSYPVPDSTWLATAQTAIERIRSGELQKLVLSRRAFLPRDIQIDPRHGLSALAAQYPGALAFAFSNLIGVSPELLVSKNGNFWQSHPLAGTAPAGSEHNLLASAKDNHEHRIVVNHIRERLGAISERMESPSTPSITRYGQISHLGTPIKGFLASHAASSMDLLLRIHPTPAVAGTPQGHAISVIQEIEEEPRQYYAGAFGVENLAGDGQWHLVIRTVALGTEDLELQAGVGLVAESDPAAELAEVRAKLGSMLPIVAAPPSPLPFA